MSLRFTILINLCLVAMLACDGPHPIVIKEAWIRKILPSQSVTAGYLMLTNTGEIDDRLLSVSSPGFETVEMHEMAIDDKSVMRMRKSGPVTIATGASLKMKAGSYHLMLIGPQYVIAAGNDIPLTLNFERAGELTVAARVFEQQ
ncbi:MAG: copper chaperone PCu(A)C [Candidatus Latescibacterota bacterium]|nr:copper chaperone PCu(A)C [Candidatus Latescibacterota bacterium]